MAFPLMSTNRRPESIGRAEKRRAQVSKLQNEFTDNKKSQVKSTGGHDLGRIDLTPQTKNEARLNNKVAMAISVRKYHPGLFSRGMKYPISIVLSIGSRLLKEFQNVSRSQIFFD